MGPHTYHIGNIGTTPATGVPVNSNAPFRTGAAGPGNPALDDTRQFQDAVHSFLAEATSSANWLDLNPQPLT